MADTAIWSTLSWPLANVVSARALIYDLVGIVPAFGPCFACSCDQKVRARLFVSSHRYFYKVSKASRWHFDSQADTRAEEPTVRTGRGEDSVYVLNEIYRYRLQL